jgi:hypothetical protein
MTAPGKRYFWILTLVAFSVMTSGCSRRTLRLVDDELARDGSGLHQGKGQAIEGYLLNDGVRKQYKGRVRLADQDSLKFWSEVVSDQVGHQGTREKIQVPGPVYALAAVKALDMKETSIGKTSLLVAVVIAGAVLILGTVFVSDEGEFIAEAAGKSKSLSSR